MEFAEGAKTHIEALANRFTHEQAQYTRLESRMTSELRAEAAKYPAPSQSDQQWLVKLQAAESLAAQFRATVTTVEKEAMRVEVDALAELDLEKSK